MEQRVAAQQAEDRGVPDRARRPALREGRRPVQAVAAGLVVGVTLTLQAVSLAVLIFSGSLAAHLPAGIGYVLLGSALFPALVALFSTVPGTVGTTQSVPAAILALVAATIAATLPAGDPAALPTVVVAVGCTSALAGLLFLLLGTFRLGGLVRFVPFPVVGGFLAGSGWLLIVGGTEIAAGVELSMTALPELLDPPVLARLVPGVVLAGLLTAVSRGGGRPLAIPAVLLTAFAAFHLVLLVSGGSLDAAMRQGWLLGPFPSGNLVQAPAVTAVAAADWGAILGTAVSIGTLLVFAVLQLLLSASGIELALRSDGDLDRELRISGVANLAAGVLGGLPGYQALGTTTLGHKMAPGSRQVGVVASLVCLGVLLAGGDVVSLVPTYLLGGVVVFVGLGLLVPWLYDTRDRMPRSDYAVVLVILLVMAAGGLLQGVAVGLGLAIVLFVVNYSRTEFVKHQISASAFRSKRERPPGHREVLRREGGRIEILELQGYLFFGTAHGLLDRVRDRVGASAPAPLDFLVIDLRRVRDLDTSAAMGFTRIQQLAEKERFQVVYTGMDDRVERRLEQDALRPPSSARTFPDLDHGLEWCEDRLLEAHLAADEAHLVDVMAIVGSRLGEGTASLGRYLDRLSVGSGEVLISAGEGSGDVYFLAAGQLTVARPQEGRRPVRLRTLLPGAIVGEGSFYIDAPRTATVVSDTPSTVLRLSAEAMRRMERDEPDLAFQLHRWFASLLAERLGDTLDTVDALLD